MTDLVNSIKQELTFEKILTTAMKTPGVIIHRDRFLRKELIKYCTEEEIRDAIQYNPARAGISKKIINRVSKSVINYETTKVTALSVAASLPSSGAAVAALGAATADITSYFVFILRTVQELAYLYGFESFNFNEDNVDSETMNFVMIFMGVMFGVQGAASTLNKLANTIAEHVAKKLAQQTLTKGTIYPIVKQVATKVGIRMTKQIFADTVASAIPILGSAMSGGVTFAMFRPCCMKLRKKLMTYNLCDPDYYRSTDTEYMAMMEKTHIERHGDSENCVSDSLDLAPVDIRHRIMIIKINKLYRENMAQEDLYNTVRGIWKASIKRAQTMDYVFGVYKSMIVAVYKPTEWYVCKEAQDILPRENIVLSSRNENRILFRDESFERGLPLDDNQMFYFGKSIDKLTMNKNAQNPITYLEPWSNV